MKNISISSLLLVFVMMISLSSCDLAGDIFEAGAWTAILGVILVIALIVWIIRKVL